MLWQFYGTIGIGSNQQNFSVRAYEGRICLTHNHVYATIIEQEGKLILDAVDLLSLCFFVNCFCIVCIVYLMGF